MAYDFNDRPNPFAHAATAQAPTRSHVDAVMKEIYWWMSAGLAISAIVAMALARSPAAMRFLYGSGLWIGLYLVELGLVFFIQARIRQLSATTAMMLFIVYAAVTGAGLSFIVAIYAAATVGTAFLVTAGTFGAMALWGTITKKDLTGMGHFAWMGFIGVFVASIVNLFLHSGMLEWVICTVGVVAFTLLAAYFVQRLRRMAAERVLPEDKLAIFGALLLYVDFVNLFIVLVQLLGGGGRRR